jgi:hypothetical protein
VQNGIFFYATVSLDLPTSLTGEVGVTIVNYCVFLQVPKNKMLDEHLEKQEESTLDKLEKKACSLEKVSTYYH